MDAPDLPGQPGVLLLAPRRAGQVGIEGGAGDLQQRARPGDVAPASLLRLDERVAVHRVYIDAKKAVARLRIPTSSRSLRFSRRSAASFWRSALVSPPSWRVPTSRPACSKRARPTSAQGAESLWTAQIDQHAAVSFTLS